MMTWTTLFHITTIALTLHNVAAAPFYPKRIAQVIDQSTALWEKACDAAGGGEKCNPQSIKSFDTLLVAAGACDQQNEADNMIDLAKSLNNDAEMIRLTQIFAQQPRNSPDSLSIPYCQSTPRHSELVGLYQCQFETVDPNNWLGGLKLGDNGTIPLGMSQVLSPSGSCLAHPQGTIPDGQQLVNITQNPFANTTGTGSGADSSSSATGTSSSSEDDEDGCDDDGDDEHTTPSITTTSNTSSPSSVAGAETIDSTLTITGAAASAIISALGLNTAPATATSTINAPSPSPSTTTVFVVGSSTTTMAPSPSSTTTVFVVASESSSAAVASAPALFKDNQNAETMAFTTLTLFAAASEPTSGLY